jgi:hypothetical protein
MEEMKLPVTGSFNTCLKHLMTYAVIIAAAGGGKFHRIKM